MARTAKTQHVMDLVGNNQKRFNPTVQEQRSAPAQGLQGESVAVSIPVNRAPMTSLQELQKRQELEELRQALAAVESELEPQDYQDNGEREEAAASEEASELKYNMLSETPAVKEEVKPFRACAVVLELINQELEAVSKRFRIEPTDNNLWELTRAVLESVRPEFALTEEDFKEKCDRLRPRVISEMAKIAIKIAKRKAE